MIGSINVKHVFIFWVISRHSSLTKAAAELHVSQSSLSEQLKVLEAQLGVQLFTRSKKGVNLTEYGKRLFEVTEKMFPQLEEVFESISNHKSTDVRFLNIGLSPALSSDVRFQFTFPFIEDIRFTVKIHRGENAYLKSAFENREIDLILTSNKKLGLNTQSESVRLTRKKMVFVARSSFAKENSNLELCHGKKLVNYTKDSDLHFEIITYLIKRNIQPVRIAEIDDILLIKNVLLSMDCFALMPYKTVETEISNGDLEIIETPGEQLQPELTAVFRTEVKSDLFEKLLLDARQNLAELFK